ncbi:hypothetical protein QBC47DRAFT_400327 [Echria macrotheca]|uniref:Uncharacterized protein n=1 Tax=Echria macrotheca TaxID=438768 RepID=A0AAJ0BEU5_9PEZI|nr:hypothetical protein QBC47DRAFT_400327 [Echria macrotheca]
MDNITVIVPVGSQFHSDSHLLCEPVKWDDILKFFLVNYMTHAFTVVTPPAATMFEKIVIVLMALFLPATGAMRAFMATVTRPNKEKNPLKRARLCGALCMVVRDPHFGTDQISKPKDVEAQAVSVDSSSGHAGGRALEKRQLQAAVEEVTSSTDTISLVKDTTHEAVTLSTEPSTRSRVDGPLWEGDLIYAEHKSPIHGLCRLPAGYSLAIVPSNAPVKFRHMTAPTTDHPSDGNWQIASSYSFAKAAISIVQLLSAASAFYRTRGNQLELYGLAAFGLTVAPYIYMSLLNCFANLCTPSYDCLFLISTPALDEARAEGAVVDGVVGSLDVDPKAGPMAVEYKMDIESRRLDSWFMKVGGFVCSNVPWAFVLGCWGVDAEASLLGSKNSPMTFGWIMAWYAAGLIIAPYVFPYMLKPGKGCKRRRAPGKLGLGFLALLAVPAAGGMVQVVLMLVDSGGCFRL